MSVHGDCHLPDKEKIPSGNWGGGGKRKEAELLLLALCVQESTSSLRLPGPGPIEEKASPVFVCVLPLEGRKGRKGRTAGRISQAYPLIEQDILSACYVAGNLVH